MAPKKRNYRAEYKRRIERALAKGYSRRLARGHAREGEVSPRAAKYLSGVLGRPVRVGEDYGNIANVSSLREYVQVDAVRVFDGRVPKRGRINPDTGNVTQRRPNEDVESYLKRTQGWDPEDAADYALRLEELKKRDGAFRWENEEEFIASMQANGLNDRDAYSFWFSP